MQRGDDALDGVIEQGAADAVLLDAEMMRRAEERLELPHGLALVVVDLSSGAHPAGVDGWGPSRRIKRAGLGLDLLLDSRPKPSE